MLMKGQTRTCLANPARLRITEIPSSDLRVERQTEVGQVGSMPAVMDTL